MKQIPIRRGFTEIRALYRLVTEHNGYICGGYARYVCSPTLDPSDAADCDIYVRKEENFDPLKAILDKYLEQKHENAQSVTYKRTTKGKLKFSPTVQLIKPRLVGAMVLVGEPETVLGNFDFTVTRACIISPTRCLVDDDFIDDEIGKKLVLKNIHCPISSTYRTIKYIKKGYWIRPREMLKLFLDWERRDPEYRMRIAEMLQQEGELSQQDIDELEMLLWVD